LESEQVEQELADKIYQFRHDPLGFAQYAYPWAEGELFDSKGPRKWQTEALDVIGRHLRDPLTRHQPCRLARSSGHGIGKSALVAFIISWGLSTCDDCKIVVTAGTGDQLSTKTVPEVGKWMRLAINEHWWDVRATSIRVKDPKHRDSWRTDFLTWSEENTQAFGGLHNKGKRIILIFDEASIVSDKVWEVAEGALTDENTEIIWLVFGNPIINTGRFRECFGAQAHRWNTAQIDSRQVEGTNKTEIGQWADLYGEDSDWFRIRVRGEFPRAGSNQFIPSDIVAAARKYTATAFAGLSKIMAVDVARFGENRTVIGWRQGRKSVILGKYRGLDTEQTAQRVIEFWESEKPDAVVVDGDGLGGGVVDHLKHRSYTKGLFEFHGGANANDCSVYFNRRTECWGLMRDWLKEGAEIPDDPELAADLTGPGYDVARGKRFSGTIFLEHKDDMKKRGLDSPDAGDMLAMTFGVSLARKAVIQQQHFPVYGPDGWMA